MNGIDCADDCGGDEMTSGWAELEYIWGKLRGRDLGMWAVRRRNDTHQGDCTTSWRGCAWLLCCCAFNCLNMRSPGKDTTGTGQDGPANVETASVDPQSDADFWLAGVVSPAFGGDGASARERLFTTATAVAQR